MWVFSDGTCTKIHTDNSKWSLHKALGMPPSLFKLYSLFFKQNFMWSPRCITDQNETYLPQYNNCLKRSMLLITGNFTFQVLLMVRSCPTELFVHSGMFWLAKYFYSGTSWLNLNNRMGGKNGWWCSIYFLYEWQNISWEFLNFVLFFTGVCNMDLKCSGAKRNGPGPHRPRQTDMSSGKAN